MKQRSTKIIASLLLIIPLLAATVPHPAFAFLGFTKDSIFWVTAWLSEIEMAFAGATLTIVGSLLNATMTATLNMSTIVNNTPAIGVAWTTIRDFGSVFIIFMLLDVSIRMILGGGESVGKLIKNIVIAGILINFSLFFTKLAVDASNIISLSFYNAIAPSGLGHTGTSVNSSNSLGGSFVNLVSGAFNDGGLSNVFMQSLDLQGFANASKASNTLNSTDSATTGGGISYWDITLANTGGAILMFFAAISFLVAAIAFAVRIGVLIMLMAFSPILFIGLIFPDLEKYRKKWMGLLYSMCLFMPIYLLLMYVAVSVLSDPHFFDFAKTTASSANVTGGNIGGLIGPSTIGIVLQYIIAIFLINAPLLAAISIASEGADFMSDMMKKVSKWGQGAISGAQKRTVGFVGQHTVGRGARMAADSEGFKSFVAKNPLLGTFAAQGLKGVAGTSFGGTKGGFDKRTEKYSKAHQDVAKSLALSDEEVTSRATLAYNEIQQKKKDLAINEAIMADPQAGDDEKMYASMAAEAIKTNIAEKKDWELKDHVKEAKTKLQNEYATNLEKDFEKYKINWTRLTKEGRKDAAKKIRKELNKTKTDNLIKELSDALEKEKKDEGSKPKDKAEK